MWLIVNDKEWIGIIENREVLYDWRSLFIKLVFEVWLLIMWRLWSYV